MKLSALLIFVVLLSFIGCKNDVLLKEGINYFGEEITPDNTVSTDNISTMTISEDGEAIKLSGVISTVCQTKGCWMYLADEQTEKSVFVRFKDYEFFVPKNSMGKKAVVQGILKKSVKSVEELKHYAEDEGKDIEEIDLITEPVIELSLMADGVIIYN